MGTFVALLTLTIRGNTQAQAENVFTKIEGLLKAQGFALGDVVMMRVYMAADPAMDSKLDFAVYRRRRLCAVF